MNKLINMTDEELIKTLDKYGIKHGPIVDTTRPLYEKKIYEYERTKTTFPASANTTQPLYEKKVTEYEQRKTIRPSARDNGDNEIYEENIYTKTYSSPKDYQPRTNLKNRNYSSGQETYQNVSQVRYQPSYSQGVEPRKPIRPKAKEEKESRSDFLPLWLQLFLLLLVAGFLVYMYLCQMTDDNPFRSIEGNQ